jgi:DNA-binding IclR family transcriptional regulator
MEELPPSYDRSVDTITAVDITCDILHAIYCHGNPTLADLDEELEYSKSSIHAHLQTLTENFMVIRRFSGNPTDLDFDGAQPRFTLSLRLWLMGREHRRHIAPPKATRSQVALLARRTGELAHFVTPEYGLAIVVDQGAGRNAIDVDVRTGDTWPMHPSAYGLAMLSQFTEEDIRSDDVLDRLSCHGSSADSIDPDTLVTDLAAVADRGYAIDDGGTIPGTSVIAAPVVADGRILGAVGVCGPKRRFQDEPTAAAASQEVRNAADAITAACVSRGN